MEFNWYSKIINSNQIEQGDLINDCPIIMPPSKILEGNTSDFKIVLLNSIVLTQSCDLANNKVKIVLVCPYFSLKTFIENLPLSEQSPKATKNNIESLKKGNLPGYHLLNKSIENEILDYIVVDFRNVYGIHIENLKEIALNFNPRYRLLPPYREHLSQAFARYFMRVGLPQDIIIEGY
jgi:hypothetical protein